MSLYRIYIDEIGNSGMKMSPNQLENYLTLAGVIIESQYYTEVLQPELENLKKKYFGFHPDEPIVFHRKEMVYNKYPFQKLSDTTLKEEFNQEFLALIANWEFQLVGVLLDKQEHCELFEFWKNNPYHYCLEVIVELYYKFLTEKNAKGDVMIETRGAREDQNLKQAFTKIYETGTHNLIAGQIEKNITSKNIKIKPKIANIAGLQLADLLGYPSHRYILKHYNLYNLTQETFSEKILDVLQNKFYCYDGGHCGIKHLPI
jgi:Protein of unknown function (DUF3800)